MNSQILIISTCMMLLAFFALPVEAQFQQPPQEQPRVEISDNELDTFIDASMNAQTVQAESQQEMVAVVNNEGIGVETYNEIMQAQQTGQSIEDLEISDEDAARFESAYEKIQEIENEMQEKLTVAIENEGIEIERFMEINSAIQQDPELQQRVQQKMMESQMQNQQPQ